jgi:glycosyltransferase involved in cell wall biosynthesis
MKICLIYQHALGDGGYPRDVRWLATTLAAHGADVTLVCGETRNTEGLSGGVAIARLESIPRELEHFDLVHIFGLFIPAHMRLLEEAIRIGIPTVLSPMAVLMPFAVNRTRWKRVKKEAFMRLYAGTLSRVTSLHLLSHSESLSWSDVWRQSHRMFGQFGIFPPDPAAASAGVPLRRTAAPFVFFGRNDVYQKGIDILLEAVRVAESRSASADASIQLVIAGRPCLKSDQFIRARIQRLARREAVSLLGALDTRSAYELLGSARALVFLSRFDGPPRPIREAISLGVPVIVSRETNMGEIVEAYDAGAVVPLDADAVAAALLEVWRDPQKCEWWRANVPKLKAALSWDRVVGPYLSGYREVVNVPGH